MSRSNAVGIYAGAPIVQRFQDVARSGTKPSMVPENDPNCRFGYRLTIC